MKENGRTIGEDTDSEDNTGSEESMSGEDGEDDGFEDQDGDHNQNNKREINDQGGKQAKSARTESVDGNLYRPPTVDELSSLRETQLLYHSNLFRMQMEEVLGEVTIKDKTRRQLQDWLARLTTFITALPKSNQYQLSDNKWMSESRVCDPTPKGMSGVKGSFVFSPPTKVEFVGSFPANTSTNLSKTVDVMVTLPKDCVHNRDWHNGGWLARRIKYGAWLAGRLQDQTDLVAGLSWTCHLGLAARPTLQITPSGSLGKKWRVNIFPVPPPEYCKVSRISPEKNKVEPGWFFNNDDTKVDAEAATPQHNWWCGVDVVMREHSQLVHESLSRHSNLAQGIKLIKIWLAQRKLDTGVGCFSGHMVTMLVLHLLQTRKVNPQMSAYQIFRNSMVALNCADWSVSGPNMGTFTEAEGPATEVFHKLYEVVFVDPSGTVNLAATLTSPDYLRIKHEAALAISFLDSTATDCFESLFIKKVEMFQLSDQIISIKLKDTDVQQILDRLESPQEHLMDSLGDPSRLVWSGVVQRLVKGLGERAALVAPLRTPPETWSIQDSPPEHRRSLALGFVLNSYAAWALLTKGPTADSPEAKQFKEFWGEKSSLRRFQDGSFHEAVLWGDPKDSIAQRRLFPEKICREILREHFGIGMKRVHFVAQQTEAILHHPDYTLDYEYATGEEATVYVIQSFDRLSTKLRSLDLPLKVSAVQATESVNRHTKVFPPMAKNIHTGGRNKKIVDNHLEFSGEDGPIKNYQYAMEAIVFLEISGKWPDDLEAIQAIKAEFHSKMADSLTEEGINVYLFPHYLQLIWEGYVFRVRVSYLREIYLRRLVETPGGDYKEHDTPESLELEKQIEIIPKFTTALASIQAEHPSFSGGVRLCKRWVGGQLLLPHLPAIAVELVVAHLYLCPAPYTAPHTPHVALLRFLQLLAHTDWSTTPFLVNLNEAFTVEDMAELNRRFTSLRSSLPHMFLATPYDLRTIPNTSEDPTRLDQRFKLASLWTRKSPSTQILFRARQLARSALQYFQSNLLNKSLDAKTVFRPSLEDYDVVIEMEKSQLSRLPEAVDWTAPKTYLSKLKRYVKLKGELMPIVMFDTTQYYLKELIDAFDHLALFFHDEHGGKVVGVVWKPVALQPKPLKINSLEGHQVVGVKEVQQVMNLDAIISDFSTLGQGLVSSVILKDQ